MKTYAEWDPKLGAYVMTTGVKVTLPAGTAIKDGKVVKKVSTYRAKQKRMQAQRTEGRWLRKAK